MAGRAGVTRSQLLREKGLDLTQLNIKCTDEHLRCISEFLVEWQDVLPYLGLEDPVREEIEASNKRERGRRLMMLQKWKQKYAFKATYKKLVEVLLKIGRADDAEKVCDLLKGQICYVSTCSWKIILCHTHALVHTYTNRK